MTEPLRYIQPLEPIESTEGKVEWAKEHSLKAMLPPDVVHPDFFFEMITPLEKEQKYRVYRYFMWVKRMEKDDPKWEPDKAQFYRYGAWIHFANTNFHLCDSNYSKEWSERLWHEWMKFQGITVDRQFAA